jgi:hypothetical protein
MELETVVVERTFEQPVDVAAMQESEKEAHWCLELHNVTFIQSYISPDRRRVICIYKGPDAESVRIANTTARLPFDRVWTASLLVAES